MLRGEECRGDNQTFGSFAVKWNIAGGEIGAVVSAKATVAGGVEILIRTYVETNDAKI